VVSFASHAASPFRDPLLIAYTRFDPFVSPLGVGLTYDWVRDPSGGGVLPHLGWPPFDLDRPPPGLEKILRLNISTNRCGFHPWLAGVVFLRGNRLSWRSVFRTLGFLDPFDFLP
jgi:hypothetical protein